MESSASYIDQVNSLCIDWIEYIFWVVVFTLLIKLIVALLKTVEKEHGWKRNQSFFDSLRDNFFKGVTEGKKEIRRKQKGKYINSDFMFNFIIGTIELAVFPVLIKVNALEVIGAWIALKTLPQWNAWKGQRHVFNRFLIGTALVIIASFLIAAFTIR